MVPDGEFGSVSDPRLIIANSDDFEKTKEYLVSIQSVDNRGACDVDFDTEIPPDRDNIPPMMRETEKISCRLAKQKLVRQDQPALLSIAPSTNRIVSTSQGKLMSPETGG